MQPHKTEVHLTRTRLTGTYCGGRMLAVVCSSVNVWLLNIDKNEIVDATDFTLINTFSFDYFQWTSLIKPTDG